MLLSVNNLEVAFPAGALFARRSIRAVAGVSFAIDAGETFALVGESGCGKTTLARAINGLQPVADGEVVFAGERIDKLSRAALRPVRRHMALMFQDPLGSLSPRMKVGDLVAEPFCIHGVQVDLRAETMRLLSLVGLSSDLAARYPHQLSGGQARRVGVARAIALNPRLIIADEPTAGLDVSVQGEVLNLLNDLREKLNLAILIITHNLHVVRHIADSMAVMYLGRIVESGSTRDLFNAPAHPYTAALLSASPSPNPEHARNRIALPAETPSLLARPPGCEFHTRCPWAQPRCATDAPPTVNAHGGGDGDGDGGGDGGGDARRVTCHYPLEPNATQYGGEHD